MALPTGYPLGPGFCSSLPFSACPSLLTHRAPGTETAVVPMYAMLFLPPVLMVLHFLLPAQGPASARTVADLGCHCERHNRE